VVAVNPDELAVPAVLVPGGGGAATFAEFPAPLGSLPELLRPPTLAGPDGTPLTPAVPLPPNRRLANPPHCRCRPTAHWRLRPRLVQTNSRRISKKSLRQARASPMLMRVPWSLQIPFWSSTTTTAAGSRVRICRWANRSRNFFSATRF
jgi:hypothetical protein